MRKESTKSGRVIGRRALQSLYTATRQEEGSFILFTTLMILVLLTLTGIAATKTATTEVSIAGNEAARNISTYSAEGGAVEAAMRIAERDDNDLKITDSALNPNYPDWMTYNNPNDMTDTVDMTDTANWDFDGDGADNAAVSAFDVNVQFAVVDKGGASGSSLIMTGGEQKREYQIYGRSDTSSGRALIELGYRKRLL